MNSTNTNAGGWPASELYQYLQYDVYNSLPADLRNVIATTRVVSSDEYGHSGRYTSYDKLYFFATNEINTPRSNDTTVGVTNILDYYQNIVSSGQTPEGYAMYPDLIKTYNGANDYYWLRSAWGGATDGFHCVSDTGVGTWAFVSGTNFGISPAFRIA